MGVNLAAQSARRPSEGARVRWLYDGETLGRVVRQDDEGGWLIAWDDGSMSVEHWAMLWVM